MEWSPNGCVSYNESKIRLHYKSALPRSHQLILGDSICVEHFYKTTGDSVVIYKRGIFLSHFKSQGSSISSKIYSEVDSSGAIVALDSFYVSGKGATLVYFNSYFSRFVRLSKTFYVGGKIRSTLYYSISGADSLYREWYESGRLKILKRFYDDGNVFNHYPYTFKKPLENSEYYSTGVLAKKERLSRHYSALYYESGARKFVSYDSIFGRAIITCEKKYYSTKKIQSIHFFQDHKPCHTWLEYSSEGRLLKSISKAAIMQVGAGPSEPAACEVLLMWKNSLNFLEDPML